jgi:PAS domain S-box-containing protein
MTMTRQDSDSAVSINGGTADRKQTVRLTLLARSAELLLDDDGSRTGMRAVFPLIAPHVGLDSYWDYDSTEAGTGLRLASSAGLAEDLIPAFQYLRYGEALCGTCAQERTPLVLHDLQDSDDPKAALAKRNGNRAYVGYPLMAGEQLLGTLGFASCGRTAFDREDIDFLATIARYVAIVKTRSRTEKRLLVEVRRREEMLLRAQRAAKAGLWEIDLRTNRVTWSEAYYELFALDRRTEPSIDGWLARIHPEDRQAVQAQYERAIAEERDQDFEYRILLPDGTVRWVHRKGQIDRDDQGRPIRLSGLTFDVTEQKHAQEALRASEERWQLAVN